MIADKISEYLSDTNATINDHIVYQIEKLSGYAFKRQFMLEQEDRKGSITLSAAGKCPRALAYNYLGFDKSGKEIDGRARIIFFQGDVVELTLMSLAKLAGCPLVATGFDQITVYSEVGGILIAGHPDGFLIEDGTKLVECKSMSSYGFEKFEKGDIDNGYRAQINMYLDSTNLYECVLVAMNKDNGVVKEYIVKRDDAIIKSIKSNLEIVLKSTKTNMPATPKEFDPDAKGFYPWNCMYCSYWKLCRPTAQVVLVGRSNKLKQP